MKSLKMYGGNERDNFFQPDTLYIKLYSFFELYEIICNLDNYKDSIHHSDDINSQILEWMPTDFGLLTKSNYKQHFDNMRDFYLNYD